MLIDPPIDKMTEKVGCRFALVCIVAKRARALQQKLGEDGMRDLNENLISLASSNYYNELTGANKISETEIEYMENLDEFEENGAAEFAATNEDIL